MRLLIVGDPAKFLCCEFLGGVDITCPPASPFLIFLRVSQLLIGKLCMLRPRTLLNVPPPPFSSSYSPVTEILSFPTSSAPEASSKPSNTCTNVFKTFFQMPGSCDWVIFSLAAVTFCIALRMLKSSRDTQNIQPVASCFSSLSKHLV